MSAKSELTGDLALVKRRSTSRARPRPTRRPPRGTGSRTRRRRNWSNGSSCATRRPRRVSAAMPRSSPPTRIGRAAALLRRWAEARLWQERSDAATVRSFTGDQPTSAKRPTCARAGRCLPKATADGAGRLVREAWRSEELSERVEAEAFEMFRDLLDARRSPGADGQADRGQGFRGRDARGASASAATSLRS